MKTANQLQKLERETAHTTTCSEGTTDKRREPPPPFPTLEYTMPVLGCQHVRLYSELFSRQFNLSIGL